MPHFPACLHDGFVSHTDHCSFTTSSPALETQTHCFGQYNILAREITVRSGRWTQESICCSSFPPLSMCNPAWLKRAEAAAAVKNETDFLHYSIRAGDSKALDMRECPLRWLRLSQWCFPWGQEQRRIRVGGRCSNRWSKRLSLLFPLCFHTHLLSWMATCQFASGHCGISFVSSMAMSSSIWKGMVAKVAIFT